MKKFLMILAVVSTAALLMSSASVNGPETGTANNSFTVLVDYTCCLDCVQKVGIQVTVGQLSYVSLQDYDPAQTQYSFIVPEFTGQICAVTTNTCPDCVEIDGQCVQGTFSGVDQALTLKISCPDCDCD